MSMDPSKLAQPIDLFGDGGVAGGGSLGTATGTRAGPIVGLPPGKKAIQVNTVTSSTVTIKVQNSLDKTNWFDVTSSTPASTAGVSLMAEVDSVIPYWRVNVTSHTTAGTGANAPLVASITQGPT